MRPGGLVIQTENVSAVRLLLLSLVEPGDIQVAYFLERRSPGVWDYGSLTRTTPRFGGHVASSINRAVGCLSSYRRHSDRSGSAACSVTMQEPGAALRCCLDRT
jgi:hypothetical protein